MIDRLREFLNKLISYEQYQSAFLQEELTEAETQTMAIIRGELIHDCGRLKPIIVELTGKERVSLVERGQEHEFDMFLLGLGSFISPQVHQALRYCIDVTNSAIGRLESDVEMGIRDKQGKVLEQPAGVGIAPPKAFIAHGGESAARDKLKDFLTALGVTPIIVEEQPSEGRSKDKNVEYYLKKCDCAIILAAKGDIDGRTGEFIPRGNILNEVGRCQEILPNRMVYLLEEGVKFPTNIDEKVWERFTKESMDKAFIKIAKELRAFGLIRPIKPAG
jgi:predicted nucleotide-binding protein